MLRAKFTCHCSLRRTANLDPTTNASAAIDQILNQNVYEGLVRVTARGEIEPALASSFEISPDGLTYTFFLRRGVVFHNAHPFTAADVTATFTRDMDEKTGHPHREYYATIEKITTPDPYTVVFHMTRVDAAFLSLLALGDSVILPEEGSSDLAHHPVGTGPFRFVEWSVGDHLRLERFGDYYREGVPLLDEVTFRFIPDAASQLAALLSGDVDLVARVPAEIALSVKDDPRYLMVAGPQNLVQILAINNEREPFTDLLVRQAIACAIDRDAIIEGTMFGMGSPIGSHLTPASPYYTDLTGSTRTIRSMHGISSPKPATPTAFPRPSPSRRTTRSTCARARSSPISSPGWGSTLRLSWSSGDSGLPASTRRPTMT